MKYFHMVKLEDMKAALLVQGGDKILSIDKNKAKPEGNSEEYEQLIAKIEQVYVAKNTSLNARFRLNKVVQQAAKSTAQYNLTELQWLAKECDFWGRNDSRLVNNTLRWKLTSKSIKNIIGHLRTSLITDATTKQDVKAQREEMKIEVKNELPKFEIQRVAK